MSEEQAREIDVEQIMDGIRETVSRAGEGAYEPRFEDIPLKNPAAFGEEEPGGALRDRVCDLMGDWTVPWIYPIPAGGKAVRAYKKVATKATRCAVMPLAQRVTDTNRTFRSGIEFLASAADRQQAEIDAPKEASAEPREKIAALEARITALEARIAALAGEPRKGNDR